MVIITTKESKSFRKTKHNKGEMKHLKIKGQLRTDWNSFSANINLKHDNYFNKTKGKK